MIELVNKKCHRELKYFNYNFTGSTKHEPLIINCNIKYDVYNDIVFTIDKVVRHDGGISASAETFSI